MAYKTVVFDLDGTLLNTLTDLDLSVNRALSAHWMPARTTDEVRAFTGNGIVRLIERSVPEGTHSALRKLVFDFFKADYAVHNMDHTAPYEGVPEMVEHLRAAGVGVAVVSNKADFAVQQIVAATMPDTFDAVLGECEAAGIARKPAPEMVWCALERMGASREGLVYVGDSEVDVATAANCGCPCIGCSWGFRSREELAAAGADVIVDTPAELERVLLA